MEFTLQFAFARHHSVPADRQHDGPAGRGIGDDTAFQTEDLSHVVFRQHLLRRTRDVHAAIRHGDKVVRIARREIEVVQYHDDGSAPLVVEIGQEIQRTLDYFGTTAEHERIQRIYLSGGCALIPGLQEFLAGQWGIEVIRANPFKRVDVGTGTDASMVEKLAPLASVATGLAMRYPDDRK